jgi:hypothetical protein
MESKKLKMILDEGGYIDYRNIFRDLESKKSENVPYEGFDNYESDSKSELPGWIQDKWKKYDMKNWGK